MSNRLIRFTFLVMVATTVHIAQMGEAAEPLQTTLEEVRERIVSHSTSHPRLLATRADLELLRTAATSDPLKQKIADDIIRRAEALLKEPSVERTVIGRRLS